MAGLEWLLYIAAQDRVRTMAVTNEHGVEVRGARLFENRERWGIPGPASSGGEQRWASAQYLNDVMACEIGINLNP